MVSTNLVAAAARWGHKAFVRLISLTRSAGSLQSGDSRIWLTQESITGKGLWPLRRKGRGNDYQLHRS